MFMRYRGGGIGHKYMREIEAKYENMSRERLHGKQPRCKPGPAQADDQDVDSMNESGDECKDPTRPEALQEDTSDDEEYTPSQTGTSDDEEVDSDEITLDFDYDSYGLADP